MGEIMKRLRAFMQISAVIMNQGLHDIVPLIHGLPVSFRIDELDVDFPAVNITHKKIKLHHLPPGRLNMNTKRLRIAFIRVHLRPVRVARAEILMQTG